MQHLCVFAMLRRHATHTLSQPDGRVCAGVFLEKSKPASGHVHLEITLRQAGGTLESRILRGEKFRSGGFRQTAGLLNLMNQGFDQREVAIVADLGRRSAYHLIGYEGRVIAKDTLSGGSPVSVGELSLPQDHG